MAQGGDTVLKPADMQKLLPASVYYKGQSATTQLRNSGGVKFADGYLCAGHAGGYQRLLHRHSRPSIQAYFITEVPIKIGGQSLPAGVYGVGFIGGRQVCGDRRGRA
jgi:hypothetical protein